MSHPAVRGLRLHALRWRAFSTSTDASPASSSLHAPQVFGYSAGQHVRPLHPRMIFVRPWDGIPTMAHAFAIVRDIERRVGRIQEFVVVRDPDVHSEFCPFLHATFSRAEDAAAIPPDGKVIQVVAPRVDRKRDGGIGLDDLHVYLNPETREQALSDKKHVTEEPDWGPPGGEVIDVKLERTPLRDPPAVLDKPFNLGRRGPPHLTSPRRTQELAYAIHEFGGFIDHHTDPQRSQTSMEAIVSRWSRMVKRPAQPPPEPVQENIVDEIPAEQSEGPVIPDEEEHPWSSFENRSLAQPPLHRPPHLSHTVDSEPKHHVMVVTPTEPKTSKKQRMLNAARLAGAVAAGNPPVPSEELGDTRSQLASPVFDASQEQAKVDLNHDPKASEEVNKVAARKWWKFLTGGD